MKYLLYLFLFCLSMSTYAQSKSSIKDHKIRCVTEKEINHESGLTQERVLQKSTFDELGRLVEFKDWSKDGKLKEWLKYSYTEDNEIYEESTLDAKGELVSREVYSYEDGLKSVRKTYDHKNRLVKEKFYVYDFF